MKTESSENSIFTITDKCGYSSYKYNNEDDLVLKLKPNRRQSLISTFRDNA